MTDSCYTMPLPVDSMAEEHPYTDLQSALRHTFFTSKCPGLPTDIPYRSTGIPGSPVPYTVRGDDMIIAVLLSCFILFVVSLSRSIGVLVSQMRDFFRPPHGLNDYADENGVNLFLVLLSLVNALALSVSICLILSDTTLHDIMERTGVVSVAILFVALVIYICMKWLVGTVVNTVLFGMKKNLQWLLFQLLMSAFGGVVIFPLAVLQIYFDYPTENALFYICIVLVLNKILTFYKSYQIFFQENGFYLQTFLYFCALEIAPMLAFGGAGLATLDSLKVFF